MLSRHPPRLTAYTIAVLLVPVAIALTFVHVHWFGQPAFAFFYLAVCFSTWYGGRYPGLATIVLSLLAANYFFVPPIYSWSVSGRDAFRLGIVLIVMLVINWLTSELDYARRRVEQHSAALQESETRYRAIVEDQTELIVRLLPNGTVLFVNEAYCRYFGLQQQDLIGKSYVPVIFEADRETVSQQVQSISIKNPIITIDNRVVVNGEIRWTQWVTRLLSNQTGDVLELQAVGRDITTLKQIEEALRLSENRLKLALEASGDGLWEWNIATGEVYLDSNWSGMLGYEADELPCHVSTWQQLIHPDDQSWVTEMLNAHLADSTKPYSFEYRVRTKLGDWKWIANYGKVVAYDPQGMPLRMVGTHKDISDRKQTEDQLRISAERISLANAELSRAARLKDEFLAGMSHELRTPLNAILGMSEVLLEEIHGNLTGGQRDSVGLIERSGQHLLALINDILDLAKVESGKMDLEIGSVDVRQLCDTSLSFVKQQAYQKHIHLRCQVDEEIDEIELDERRIGQVLINLLSNAVKFTPEGGRVQLSVRVNPEQETIEFSISDTGIGIAPDQMDRLFQPFVQLDSRLSRRYSGTGLGLVLVRRIVELHGGSVTLTSEIGQGSCFTVMLPWRRANQSLLEGMPAPLTTTQFLPIQKALIVEDSEAAANQVSRYLTELGATTVVHPLGQGVVDLTLQTKPDVIILDILLPDLPGWEVLMELKAHSITRTIPVLIISVVDDRPKGLALGAADYLLKPITRLQLQQAVKRLTGVVDHEQKTALVVAAHASVSAPLIVLAEDNEANIEVILNYLQAYGLRTAVARNGLEAVQLVKQCHPDLVLMDIQMPEMDGLEAICRIRADTTLAPLPILALTALAMPGDRDRCLTVGANEYLTKPVSLKQLLQLIQQYLPDWST
ncbi:MAG: response regulator [Oculatellaceae cyanobacterium bins.114]|nr:response regulator [Oculatellaceae cyanobacterium bins.114]